MMVVQMDGLLVLLWVKVILGGLGYAIHRQAEWCCDFAVRRRLVVWSFCLQRAKQSHLAPKMQVHSVWFFFYKGSLFLELVYTFSVHLFQMECSGWSEWWLASSSFTWPFATQGHWTSYLIVATLVHPHFAKVVHLALTGGTVHVH